MCPRLFMTGSGSGQSKLSAALKMNSWKWWRNYQKTTLAVGKAGENLNHLRFATAMAAMWGKDSGALRRSKLQVFSLYHFFD